MEQRQVCERPTHRQRLPLAVQSSRANDASCCSACAVSCFCSDDESATDLQCMHCSTSFVYQRIVRSCERSEVSSFKAAFCERIVVGWNSAAVAWNDGQRLRVWQGGQRQ